MKTLAELQAIRDRVKKEISGRQNAGENDVRIIVGMGTCGIAVGARTILNALAAELEKTGADNIVLTQTGCVGTCSREPIVDVVYPGGAKKSYFNVTLADVPQIVIDAKNDVKIIVGMGTCGIMAGARTILNAISAELSKTEAANVILTQAGCIGMCSREPIVEIVYPDGTKKSYFNAALADAPRIVADAKFKNTTNTEI